jgi:hypothetical protein
MKTLLQKANTGLYLGSTGRWTSDSDKARDFKSSVTARTYCESHGILHAQIVLKFNVDRYDIVLPVRFSRFEHGPSGHMRGV